MNRMACLRLIERCADSLYSVRAEIADEDDTGAHELHDPIAKLVAAFAHVHELLHHQATRPVLKSYLKRDEILRTVRGLRRRAPRASCARARSTHGILCAIDMHCPSSARARRWASCHGSF
jgi:hypothetical protein